MFSLSSLLFLSSLSLSLSLSLLPPHERNFTLGPFTDGMIKGALSLSEEERERGGGEEKIPNGIFGVIFWGNWLVLDAETKEVIPRGVYFLHHINMYEWKGNQRFYVSGSSDERATWGPHFGVNSLYLYEGNSLNNWTFDGKLTDLTWKRPVLVQYTVLFRYPHEYPHNYLRTIALSFTSYPRHTISSATEAFEFAISKAHVPLPGPQDSLGTLIHLVSHLHVGGVGVNVTHPISGEEICYSIATHTESEKCYIECPVRCKSISTYNSLSSISSCDDVNVTVKISDGLDMEVRYDRRCGYTGLHGSLYAWLAPAHQQWFDQFSEG